MSYTPTTEKVQAAYRATGGTTWYEGKADALDAEFNRWVAEVKAQAVHELVARIEAAVILLGDGDITPTGQRMISKVLNHYRGVD